MNLKIGSLIRIGTTTFVIVHQYEDDNRFTCESVDDPDHDLYATKHELELMGAVERYPSLHSEKEAAVKARSEAYGSEPIVKEDECSSPEVEGGHSIVDDSPSFPTFDVSLAAYDTFSRVLKEGELQMLGAYTYITQISSTPKVCECGVASIGGGKHSSWCPLND